MGSRKLAPSVIICYAVVVYFKGEIVFVICSGGNKSGNKLLSYAIHIVQTSV